MTWRIRKRSIALATLIFGLPLVFGLAEAIRAAWLGEEYLAWVGSADPIASAPSFLWAVLIEALRRVGFDIGTLGRYLPIVCWAAVLAVLVVHAVSAPLGRWVATMSTKGTRHDLRLMVPVAAWGLALNRDAQVYASGGLETALFTLLLTGGLLMVVNHPRQNGLGASLYALAALVHHDGFLHSAIAAAFVLRRGGMRRLIGFAAVWSLLILPYRCWALLAQVNTVGDGAFSDIAIGTTSLGVGWHYTTAYFRVYFVLFACCLGALAGWLLRLAWSVSGDPRMDAVSLGLLHILLSVVLVVVRGGDPMFARAFIPVTPIIYLLAEEMIRMTGSRRAVTILAVFVVLSTLAARLPR